MPSINVDLGYLNHIKTMRLVARLGDGADILPIRLWIWVGTHQPESGRLGLLEGELEHVCGWWGEKGAMVREMIQIGFLERDGEFFHVHDWLEHSGHLSAFKKRSIKANKKRWGDISKSRSPLRSPKSSIKESSYSTSSTSITTISIWFENLWVRYPQKGRVGKKAALRHFLASVKTQEDAESCAIALATYLGTSRVKEGFIQNAATWFNNWKDWVSYQEPLARVESI